MEVLCKLFVYAEPIEGFQVLRKKDIIQGTLWDNGSTTWDGGKTIWDEDILRLANREV